MVRDGNANIASLTARAYAELQLWSGAVKSGGYTTSDINTDAGRHVPINLPGRTSGLTSLSIPIVEVEIGFDTPTRTYRKAKFNSAIRIDFVDVVRSIRGDA